MARTLVTRGHVGLLGGSLLVRQQYVSCDGPPPPIAPPPADAKASMAALRSFQGEVAIVTGAATGIGKAVAELLVEAGARVYAIDIKRVEIAGLRESVECDVSNVASLQATIKRIVEVEGGRIDHLVCSAGVWTYGDVDKTSEAEFDRVVGINLKGTFFSMAAVLPAMVTNRSGSIVLIGSDQSFVGKPGQNLYGMTKGAIAQLVKSTAAQYAPEGVRVNAVCPGTVDTPLMRGAVDKIVSMKRARRLPGHGFAQVPCAHRPPRPCVWVSPPSSSGWAQGRGDCRLAPDRPASSSPGDVGRNRPGGRPREQSAFHDRGPRTGGRRLHLPMNSSPVSNPGFQRAEPKVPQEHLGVQT